MGQPRKSTSAPIAALNFEPLTSPITKAEVRAFRKSPGNLWLRTTAALIENNRGALGAGVILLTICVLGVEYGLIDGLFYVSGTIRIVLALIAVLMLFALSWCWETLRRDVFVASPWARWYRLTGFAATNGLTYSVQISPPRYPATIFLRGDARAATDVIGFTKPIPVQMGNYHYSGEIEIGRVREWGFVRLQLDRRLPHMVLEAKTRHRLTGTRFPVSFSSHQILSLEGDFDRYFTLYVPRDYERDALYVVTPDLMALLIDEAAPFDVEIVDDWMYIYSHLPFEMAATDTYSRLDRILETVGAKARRQSSRYWDDRVASRDVNLVAPHGRRLRRPADRLYVIGASVIVAGIATILVAEAIIRR